MISPDWNWMWPFWDENLHSHKFNSDLHLFVLAQIGGKWALDLHFTLLLIPFSMLKEAHFKYRKRAKEVHPSGSAIQSEKKGTSSVALQVPFWATWEPTWQE